MDPNGKYKLTQSGIDQLRLELETLKTVDRERNLEALKEARAQGDLSENADYDAARDEQARIEKRIKELEIILKNAELIKEDHSNKVNIGKLVTLKLNGLEPKDYTIVGTLEANPLESKISNESPVGKAVIGHKKGESVTFKTEANKEVKVTIVDVK
ncbi:transcription elongation factor GreA [Liberiplasma polymorphum]|uniref:transcription elongation factor GreA n=1 Tax=Liberiplasma polymorphum TaxID=3374570 RepID=UPI0037729212